MAAGLLDGDGVRYALNGRVLPSTYRYDDQDIISALLTVSKRLGRPPRTTEYQRERQNIHDELHPVVKTHVLPTVDVIRNRFGTWNKALIVAGLAALESPHEPHLGEKSPRYTDAEKLAWLTRAWAEVGEPFTANSYKRWRQGLQRRGEPFGPCLPTIERTFGGWTNACTVARPGGTRDPEVGRVHE